MAASSGLRENVYPKIFPAKMLVYITMKEENKQKLKVVVFNENNIIGAKIDNPSMPDLNTWFKMLAYI